MWKVSCLVCVLIVFVESHPTMYKMNENRVLEPDLVPISSTVIPLPVYQVGYGFNIKTSYGDEKTKKPEGQIQLVTVYSKKKPIPTSKAKPSDVSQVKEISKKEYGS